VQPFLDLFCPVLNFVIDVGSSTKLVADVHIHARLGSGEDPGKLLLQRRFYTHVSWIKQHSWRSSGKTRNPPYLQYFQHRNARNSRVEIKQLSEATRILTADDQGLLS
jgi:hypothetical protein